MEKVHKTAPAALFLSEILNIKDNGSRSEFRKYYINIRKNIDGKVTKYGTSGSAQFNDLFKGARVSDRTAQIVCAYIGLDYKYYLHIVDDMTKGGNLWLDYIKQSKLAQLDKHLEGLAQKLVRDLKCLDEQLSQEIEELNNAKI